MLPSIPADICDAFACVDGVVETLTGGRMNDTWRVTAERDLVIQRVRAESGIDLLGVMENLVRVTQHLEWAHHTGPDRDQPTWWPVLVPTRAGRPFLIDDHGDVWRAFVYRPGRIARGPMPAASIISAARAFGRFTAGLSDFGGDPLAVSMPRFHDLDAVMADFEAQVAAASSTNDPRLALLVPHIERLGAIEQQLGELAAHDGLDAVAHRVVHNDTKLSNALLAADADQAIAVLDFDLAMMGPIWHDVGDMVRSGAWHHRNATGAEPVFDLDQTEAVLRAFAETAGSRLSDDELVSFAVAGPRLAFELGVRYLTDHLRDVPVLRVAGENGHLERGLANINLSNEMLSAYHALRSLVDHLIDTRAR